MKLKYGLTLLLTLFVFLYPQTASSGGTLPLSDLKPVIECKKLEI